MTPDASRTQSAIQTKSPVLAVQEQRSSSKRALSDTDDSDDQPLLSCQRTYNKRAKSSTAHTEPTFGQTGVMAHCASPRDSCHHSPSTGVVCATTAPHTEHTLGPTPLGLSSTSASLESDAETTIFPSSMPGASPQQSAIETLSGASIKVCFLTPTRDSRRIVRLAADFNIDDVFSAIETAFDEGPGGRRPRQLIFVPPTSFFKGPVVVARNDQATWEALLDILSFGEGAPMLQGEMILGV